MASPPIQIRPLRDARRFLEVQRQFYRGDPHYVPPLTFSDRWQLDPNKNELFAHADADFWIAERDGAVVGRISAVRNRIHDDFHGDQVGFFGHFEARDEATAHALLDHAAAWLGARGATAIRGPIDLSTSYKSGLLVSGEPGPPVVMMPHNPPQYADWLESWGLRKAKDLLALMMDAEVATPQRFERLAARISKRTRAVIRQLDMRRFRAESQLLWSLYNRIWERNWGFVPMTEGEFLHMASELKLIARKELLVVVEIDGEPVGFALCVPDVHAGVKACDGRLFPFGWWKLLRAVKQTDVSRVITLGVVPEHRGSGLDALLLHHYYHNCIAIGYPKVEASWVLEDNHAMLSVLHALGGYEYRRYRVYERPWPPDPAVTQA